MENIQTTNRDVDVRVRASVERKVWTRMSALSVSHQGEMKQTKAVMQRSNETTRTANDRVRKARNATNGSWHEGWGHPAAGWGPRPKQIIGGSNPKCHDPGEARRAREG